MDVELGRRSLLAIKQLKAKVKALEEAQHEPIAVIGMACRLPGAESIDALWKLLEKGAEAPFSSELGDRAVGSTQGAEETWGRWGLVSNGGSGSFRGFDARFFGIPAVEANRLEPQQRLMLEVSWEAIEHAGVVPGSLVGKPVGVYVGNSSMGTSMLGSASNPSPFDLTGSFISVLAGRVSYTLNLRGPSMVFDTACSSSIVAIVEACKALRARECTLALAGGVRVTRAPGGELKRLMSLGILTKGGHCRPFDAAADGTLPSEGCGMLVLKRLRSAQEDGDRILAVLRGGAVNHCGHGQAITVPDAIAQEAVIRAALEDARVPPDAIGYVECHGTGTPLGDPIEAAALGEVFRERSPSEQAVLIGSIKGNIGHTASTAGVASVIKVALSFLHGKIPPSANFETPNPHIPWSDLPLRVASSEVQWPAGKRKVAGVSGFGLSGTNAHLIMEEPPAEQAPAAPAASIEPREHVLLLSAVTEEALDDQLATYGRHVESHPEQGLADICYMAATRRSHFEHRACVVASTREQLISRLRRLSEREDEPEGLRGVALPRGGRPKVGFLFTGQGAQYPGMGRTLFETEPVFKAALQRCADTLGPSMDRPLLSLLFSEEVSEEMLAETRHAQPALFAFEYALAELWRSWGVTPDAVMGHSLGEFVAATVAGVFSLEDGLKLVAARARAMQALPAGGVMFSVQASEGRVRTLLEGREKEIAIAALNAPGRIVVSGAAAAVASLVEGLAREGVETKQLRVSHAFHSPLMAPVLDELKRVVGAVRFGRPNIPLFGNVMGTQTSEERLGTPEYWLEHVMMPVRFADGLVAMAEHGITAFVEIGPRPTLLQLGPACLPDKPDLLWLPSIRVKGEGDPAKSTLLKSVGALHLRGRAIDWDGLYRANGAPHGRVDLPTYPFQREDHWEEDVTPSEPLSSEAARAGREPAASRKKTDAGSQLLAQLREAAPEARLGLLQQALRQEVARLVGLADASKIPADARLSDVGVDSLVALDLRNRICKWFDAQVPATLVSDHPTIEKQARFLLDGFWQQGEPVDLAPAGPPSDPWFCELKSPRQPWMRIVAFSGTGGFASDHVPLVRYLPEGVEVLSVQIPGRWPRQGEAAPTDMAQLAAGIAEAILKRPVMSTLLYGHSLGGSIALETGYALQKHRENLALGLVVFGARSPGSARPAAQEEDAFFEWLFSRSGTAALSDVRMSRLKEILPERVLASDKLLQDFLDVGRTDYTLLKGYWDSVLKLHPEPLRAPIAAVVGTGDRTMPEGLPAVAEWARWTSAGFEARLVEGTHTAPLDAPADVVGELLRTAARVEAVSAQIEAQSEPK